MYEISSSADEAMESALLTFVFLAFLALSAARLNPAGQNESAEEVRLVFKDSGFRSVTPEYLGLSYPKVEPALYSATAQVDKRPNLGDTLKRARKMLKTSTRSLATIRSNMARASHSHVR